MDLKNKEKIRVCREKMVQLEKVDVAPKAALEYLSEVWVLRDKEILPEMSAGPMVCDSKITLSKDEYAFLVKGAQFMVRQKIDAENFRVEVEKMIIKNKYQEMDEPDEGEEARDNS